MNAFLQTLFASSANSFLPIILENPFVLNKCLFIKKYLHKELNYSYDFLQKDHKNLLQRDKLWHWFYLNKDCENNEKIDAGEFLNSSAETHFEDKLFEYPSQLQLSEISQFLACKHKE